MRKKAIESLLCTGSTSSIHTHTLDPLSVRPRPKAATSAPAFTNTAGGGAFVSQIKFMATKGEKVLKVNFLRRTSTTFEFSRQNDMQFFTKIVISVEQIWLKLKFYPFGSVKKPSF